MSRVGQCPFIPPASTDPVVLQLNDQIRQLQLALNNLSVGGVVLADETWLHISGSTVSHIGPSSAAGTLSSSPALGVSSAATTLSSITLTAFALTFDAKGHGVSTVGLAASVIKLTTDAWLSQTIPGTGSLTLNHAIAGAASGSVGISPTLSINTLSGGATFHNNTITLSNSRITYDAKGHVVGTTTAQLGVLTLLSDNWINLIPTTAGTLSLTHDIQSHGAGTYDTTLGLGGYAITGTSLVLKSAVIQFDERGHSAGTATLTSTGTVTLLPASPGSSGIYHLAYSNGTLTWILAGAC